jgi:flagellin
MTSINTNINALTASNALSRNGQAQQVTMQQLSTGKRINRASDDSAGLAIRETMTAQIKGLNNAIKNANDGISLAQTGEGALGKVTDMLQRMRELAVQSANATNSSSDRSSLNSEYSQLAAEITRTLGATAFNGTSLLNTAATLSFQIGAGTSSVTDQIAINLSDMTSTSGSLATAVASTSGISTASAATSAMTAIDNALDQVLEEVLGVIDPETGGRVMVFAPVLGFADLSAGQPVRFRARISRPVRRDLSVAVLTATGPPAFGEASGVQRAARSLRDRFAAAARSVLAAPISTRRAACFGPHVVRR